MFIIKTFPFNLLQENTYVVSDETKECIIIDCGAYYEEERRVLIDYITNNGLKPKRLIATHGHWDHNLGNDTVFNAFHLKVEVAAEDEFLLKDLPQQFKDMIGAPLRREYPPIGRFFDKDEVISFGNQELQILKTPGHSPGSVVFYNESEHIAFTGDTLFKMSVGRTDFDRGSYQDLMNSLQEVIAKLPAETVVYSGHGPKTTIREELLYNPYLQTTL